MLPIVTVLAIIAAALWWQKQHPYVVTRAEMRIALERVANQSMPKPEWSRLLEKRIPRDRYLDSVRMRLAALTPLIGKEDDPVRYSTSDSEIISAILNELHTKRA
jgi:hypothetical protein